MVAQQDNKENEERQELATYMTVVSSTWCIVREYHLSLVFRQDRQSLSVPIMSEGQEWLSSVDYVQ